LANQKYLLAQYGLTAASPRNQIQSYEADPLGSINSIERKERTHAPHQHRFRFVHPVACLHLLGTANSQHIPNTAPKAGNPANTTTLVGGPDTVVNCVQAQVGRIAMFTAATLSSVILCNSGIYEATPYGTGAIGILNPHPIAALDVNGATNTSLYYQIGETRVVSIGSQADENLFIGVGAGNSNQAGQGITNTFVGYDAGFSNTTGIANTFSGAGAGYSNTTGLYNTFSGLAAGSSNTSGDGNTFLGLDAGSSNTSGSFNTFFGWGAGSSNITGFSDVYIANSGPISGSESNTIRIGTQGTGLGQQNVAYIAGIYGSTASSGVPVYVNSLGQLGTSPSSLRYKEQVRNMGDSTSALMKLRPVTFLYKPEYADGERTLQYGLIAEEVAKVYPELVAYDKDGQPYSVRYQYLSMMLLNEMQKQYHRAEAEAKVITAQEQKIDQLEQRLSRLESLIPQTIAQK
jgi:hypothetical protein